MATLEKQDKTKSSRPPSVLIVGAGFAGLYCAKMLGRKNVTITIIDRRNFHLFQPLLYQVASGSLSSGDIASPVRSEFADQQNVTVLQAEVSGFDCTNKNVLLSDGESLSYDFLIVATGSNHHYFGRDDWEKLAPGLKTLEDALEMRSRILHAFEEAEVSASDKARSMAALTFVIVGGGPTGVELGGTIGELAHQTMRGEFRRINPAAARIIIVENDDRVLPMFDRGLSDKAGQFLTQLGVELKLGYKVTDITDHDVELTGEAGTERIPCRTVLWAAGNKASPLGKLLAGQTGAETDRAGRVMVNGHLNVADHKEVFALGDIAHCIGEDGNPLPGVASVAMQQGKYTAKNINSQIRGRAAKPFNYFNKGSLAVVGRNRAIAERGKVKLSGWFAWLMWAFIHIAYLIQFQSRAVVMFRWAVNYITRARGVRLITGEGLTHPQKAEPSGVHPSPKAEVESSEDNSSLPENPEKHTL